MGGVRMYTVLMCAVLVSGLAAMLPLAWLGADALASSYRETAARELEAHARLLSLAIGSRIEGRDVAELAALSGIARADSATRYTLVRKDGVVVADSDEDPARMENHANRPEIRAALAGSTLAEIRPSPTLGADWMYVAVPLEDGNVVRAAASLRELNERLAVWWRRVLAGLAAALAVLMAMALVAARSLSGPIEAAAAAAERYTLGDLGYRLPPSGPKEVRRLSLAMGDMAGQLDARFRLVNRQREEMRVVFENMSEGIVAVDDGGRVMLVNGAAAALLGFSGEVAGAGIETVVRNADLLDALVDTRSANESLEREMRVPREPHGDALVHIHTARITENGESVGVLAVLRDVTRLRRLENMRRDFVANVSHELRTPITTIQSSLETIIEDGCREGGREFAEMALRNTRRMGAIIDNLLFLAGMESGLAAEIGRVAPNPVSPVLDEAVSLCGGDAAKRNIPFMVECPAGLAALMNPQLVVHALVNILDNAIKYGPEGGAVRIEAAADGDRVSISVSDQGPGIAPRHQSRVFERFYRVDGAPRVKKGSGLGLAIVKHIALSQGGDIRLESEIGVGSRFTLSLPGA